MPYGYYGKLQIPTGATRILFSSLDSNFAGNSDPDGDFGIWVRVSIYKTDLYYNYG